ncbi:spore germination protein [Cohnella sp. AR92]|uniref:spore germination protein n=1 Tax=Cohnella sp. AR92 TaxID=648716 RepID=UPI000F8E58E2|nr:spore germination protein [Cohnella sp. AR92]RUS46957.1 spore germination protein [Cohnella sp. AR92]
MPAIVGAVNIIAIDGIFTIGDVGTIAPVGFFKTFAGGGSFNAGETVNISNSPSVFNVYGNEVFEQNIVANRTEPRDGQEKLSTASEPSDGSEQEDNRT